MDNAAVNDWWRGAVIYQVYPRSFMDANGDGIGDIPGLIARLPYIAELGVDALWLSPFFRSPMRDFGYDVSDYRAVDPMFGTLDDFGRLVREAYRLRLKVLIDLVVSHTSNQHAWFKESARDRDNPKADWYVWSSPKPDGTPPNNWLSHFGGPAWTWNARRRQYYFHNFLAEQPDLNYHNPAVRAAVLDIFRFWLEQGVDGFRLDTVNMYFHDRRLLDNPPCPPEQALSDFDPYDFQNHLHDKSQPENAVFLEDVRRLVDQYPGQTLIGEIGGDPAHVAPLLTTYTAAGKRLHMAYVFDLFYCRPEPGAIRREVERLTELTKNGWICWSLANHDVKRLVSRWDREGDAARVAPLALGLLGALRGSVCLYQGEELGLPEADIPFDLLQDPHGKAMWPEFKGRDGCRTPLPWTQGDRLAGFTAGSASWLPVPDSHRALAVDKQAAEAESALNRCRRFLAWRKTQPALIDGGMTFVPADDGILAWLRRRGDEEIAVAVNLTAEPITIRSPFPAVVPLAGHGFGGRLEGDSLVLPGFDIFFGSVSH